jgi:hypothetical protein
MDMQERIAAEVEREGVPKAFEVLGPGSEVAKSHKVRIEPGDKATFVVRPLKPYVNEVLEDQIPFVFNCSEIDFYRPDLKTALIKVKEEKNNMVAQDCDVYQALIMEVADVLYSNLDRRAMATGNIFERVIMVQYDMPQVRPLGMVNRQPIRQASPVTMMNPNMRVSSQASDLSLQPPVQPATNLIPNGGLYYNNPAEALKLLVSLKLTFRRLMQLREGAGVGALTTVGALGQAGAGVRIVAAMTRIW